jgi:hypothetical protein
MTIWAIAVITCLYLFISGDNIRQGDYPHSLMWFAYALANTGLLWYEYNKAAGHTS